MSTFYRISCVTSALLLFNHAAIANPMLQVARDVGKKLIPRLDTNLVGCSDDQKVKVESGFADAAALAGIAWSSMDQSSTA